MTPLNQPIKNKPRGKSPGRPPRYDSSMQLISLYLPNDQLTWLRNQPQTASETIRQLIQQAMDRK